MRHHLKLIHLPYRNGAWSAQFQYSEMPMSTEFMFLFCSKCKLLHRHKPTFHNFWKTVRVDSGGYLNCKASRYPSQNPTNLTPSITTGESPAAHCFFGARGLGFEQCSYVGSNSSTKSFGIRRRAAIRFPRIHKFSAIELLINDAWFLAKECIRDQDRLCFHLYES